MSTDTTPRRLRVGMSLSAHYEIGADPREGLRNTLEQVDAAEEAGLDTILLGHHYLTRSQFLQPVPVIAHLAARTSRVRLGFGVHLIGLHNPLAMAEEFATLDQLSGGRLILGLGSGYRSVEFRAFGIDPDDRYRRFEECVTVLRDLLTGREVTHSGSFGDLAGAKIHLPPVQPGGPPIWLGAFGPVGVRRAARLDTSWLIAPNGDLDELRQRMDQWVAALTRYGHSPDRDRPLLREGAIAATRAEAIDTAAPFLAEQYRNYRGWQHGASIEDLVDGQAVIGDPEQVAARLAQYAALGYTDVIMRLQWADMPTEHVLRSIRLLGREVIPALAGVQVTTPEISPKKEA